MTPSDGTPLNFDILTQTSPPWLLVLPLETPRAFELSWKLNESGHVSRTLRDKKMRTLQGMFDEFAAALQFPDYFGENWPALAECLTDLSWLPGSAYVLICVDSLELLADESPDQLAVLLRTLDHAASEWARPISQGEPWDRAAVPFHVLFQEHPRKCAELQTRFRASGSEIPFVPQATS
jgi:hypothetical protein